jgi:hypothetical protein
MQEGLDIKYRNLEIVDGVREKKMKRKKQKEETDLHITHQISHLEALRHSLAHSGLLHAFGH